MFRLAVVLLIAFGLLANAQAQQQQKSFHPVEAITLNIQSPYLDKSFSNRYFEFGGDVLVRNDKYIRLTQDKPGQRGYFFSKLPLKMPAYQIEFDINIHGTGSSIYGDGMALWALDKLPQEGSVFGINDYFNGLGIFIDTYKNDRPGRAFPYVMAMVGDGKTRYDAEHDGAANELAGCSARGLHNNDHPTRGRLIYVQGKFLSLELDYRGKGEWEKCFAVNGVTLPDQLYFGYSAQTGELSSNHDLIKSRGFFLRSPPDSFDDVDEVLNGRAPVRPAVPSESKVSGGWLWFFFKILLVAGALVLAYFGYGVWLSNKRRKQEAYYL